MHTVYKKIHSLSVVLKFHRGGDWENNILKDHLYGVNLKCWEADLGNNLVSSSNTYKTMWILLLGSISKIYEGILNQAFLIYLIGL